MAARNYKFESAWLSERGFANEGAWVYGTAEQMTKLHKQSEHGVGMLRGHVSIEAARKRCEYMARKETRDAKKWGEQSYESVANADELLNN